MYKQRYDISCKGLSLVELMVAITLSLVLFVALVSIYLSAVRHYKNQSQQQTQHNNANIALQILKNEIAMAGFNGCRQDAKIIINNDTPYELNMARKIELTETSLIVSHRSASAVLLAVDMINNHELYIRSLEKIAVGSLLLISDCANADIFEVARVSQTEAWQKIVSVQPLKNKYRTQTPIGYFEQSIFHFNAGHLYLKKIKQYSQDLIGEINRIEIKPNVLRENLVQEINVNQLNQNDKILGISIVMQMQEKKLYEFISCCDAK